MVDAIEKVPSETRWVIATKGLTGAFTACANALKDAAGEQRYNEFNAALWHEAGKGAKEFADTLGLTAKNPKDIDEIIKLLAITAMGPEFDFEVVEATEDKCVARATKCVWHERWKELGLEWDLCGAGHQRWGDGAVESLDPNFAFRLTKSMVRGDPCCEWVVERKR